MRQPGEIRPELIVDLIAKARYYDVRHVAKTDVMSRSGYQETLYTTVLGDVILYTSEVIYDGKLHKVASAFTCDERYTTLTPLYQDGKWHNNSRAEWFVRELDDIARAVVKATIDEAERTLSSLNQLLASGVLDA